MPSFEGNLFTQWHQITSLETTDYWLLHGEDPESLYHLGLVRHRVVSDGAPGRDRGTEFP